MARQLRIDYPGAWHHVMNRGARKDPIFHLAADARDFLDLVGTVVERFGIEVHCYCLMGNHYHLLVRSVEANLSRALQHLDGVYTQRYNRRHGHDGPLFRGRFRSLLVDSEEYLMAVAVYVHRNPIEAGMVTELAAHRWSSYPSYLGSRPPAWLSTEEIRSRVPTRAALRALTERTPLPPEVEIFYSREHLGPVLGSDAFRVEAQHHVELDRELAPHHSRLGAQRSIESIVEVVAAAFAVDTASITLPSPGRRNVARSVAIALATQDLGRSLTEVAQAFGLTGPSSAKSARSLIAKLAADDDELEQRIREIERRLGRDRNLRKSRSDPERDGGQDWR